MPPRARAPGARAPATTTGGRAPRRATPRSGSAAREGLLVGPRGRGTAARGPPDQDGGTVGPTRGTEAGGQALRTPPARRLADHALDGPAHPVRRALARREAEARAALRHPPGRL